MNYYPVFLNLTARGAVIVGGGKVAERKAVALIKAGASLTVISPRVTGGIARLRERGLLSHVKRSYRKGDLKNAFIVIAATSSPRINTRISRDAAHLINVIDTPSEGNFIAPSVVSRGPLTIAISTGGRSPAAAKTIRKELEKLYGREFTRYLTYLGVMRKKAMKEIRDSRKREMIFRDLASEKVFKELRRKGLSCLPKSLPSLPE